MIKLKENKKAMQMKPVLICSMAIILISCYITNSISAFASDGDEILLQRSDLNNYFPFQDFGSGGNIIAQAVRFNQFFDPPDDSLDNLESTYTGVVYGMGQGEIASKYNSSGWIVFGDKESGMDLSSKFTGATNIGIYMDNSLLIRNSENVFSNQTRSWATFEIPEHSTVDLNITGRREFYEELRTEIQSKFENAKAAHEFNASFPRYPDWNMSLSGRYPGWLSWDIGAGYTDIAAADGLEYYGSMDVILSSN